MWTVAFLRAINVGGHVVKMGQLRTLFEMLGLREVQTFIASGNVIFESRVKSTEQLENKIERHLHTALGYGVATFIRSGPEIEAIAGYEPFPDVDSGEASYKMYVGFLASPPPRAAQLKLEALGTENERFRVHGREVYWLIRGNFSDSVFSGGVLERIVPGPATFRNINTVRRLAAKYAATQG